MHRSFRLVVLFVAGLFAPAVDGSENSLTIGLIGDSTVASTYGWGPAFAEQTNDDTSVLNYARNGATLDSLSSKLDQLLAQSPDYVLIQFGHNDQKKYGTEAYGKKLASYVERVQQAGAKAVVLSSVTRRGFDKNGKIQPRSDEVLKATLPFYASAAKAVAKELQVPFIDLYSISVEHHNQIGPEQSRTYNFQETDTTHFSETGAAAVAGLVITELKSVAPELAQRFQ